MNIHPSLQKVIKEEGLEEFTRPQLQAIPEILKGKHCLLIAPTGMGKTEAVLIPIFHLFLNKGKAKGISILYITPLRALNRDMLRRTISWGRKLGIDIAVRHGDTPQKERRMQSKKPPDMLITTPETIQILFTGKNLRKSLQDVKWVIIDEIHELAGDERGAQLSVALERLVEIAGDFQRIGLSATIGCPKEVANFLAGGREVKIIETDVEKKMEISVEMPEVKEIDKKIAKDVECDLQAAAILRRAMEEINTHDSTLFFVNTRDTAEMLASRLHELGASIEVHHGSLSRAARIEAEENFKRGKVKSLLCTSSMELGIDVGHTDFVLQHASPRQVTRLIQRVGRSGHTVGKTAKGLILSISPEDMAEAIVIARRAMKGQLEEIKIRKNPLAVLANQIILFTLEYGKIDVNKVYSIVKRAYPFSSLQKDVFLKVIQQLHQQRIIWFDGKSIERKRRSRDYFIENISMIPDEKSINVFDVSSNKKIGKLDESFVMNFCIVGTKFIMKGRAWEIVNIDENVIVSPSKRTRIVPDWAGEEIPVPFEVAQEVGKLRRNATNAPLQIRKEVREQIKQGFVVPTDKTITIEMGKEMVYLITHFGSKTNETIGRIIASFLSQRYGESIGMKCDAYRISLHSLHPIDPEMIKDIFYNIPPGGLEDIIKIILKNSSFIRWELIKVARKFGILSKEAKYDFSPEKILDIFEGYPIVDEVIEKVMWERMDIENAKRVIKKIQHGEIEFVVQKISPIALEGEKWEKMLAFDATIMALIKKRLMETRLTQLCMNCFYSWETKAGRASISCPKCGGRMLSILKRRRAPSREQLRKEKKEYRRLYKTASLVATYGKNAILVLAGHGVGPDTAARILAKQKKGNELLEEIVKAEITYAKTRQFWD